MCKADIVDPVSTHQQFTHRKRHHTTFNHRGKLAKDVLGMSRQSQIYRRAGNERNKSKKRSVNWELKK